MSAPIIFAGANAKLLNSGNIVNAAGASLTTFKNYFANTNNASGWTASAGGIAVSTETTRANLPDAITQLTGVKFLRASGTDYAYYRFTLDSADYNKMLQIAWDQAYAGTAGDYTLSVFSNTASNYAGTSTQLTTPTSSIAAFVGSFNTTFVSPNSVAPYMEMRINGIAGTTPLYLNNVTVGPGILVQGAAIADLGDIGATFTGYSSLSNFKAQYYRSGNLLKGTLYWTSASVTASIASLVLPSGYTIDYSKLTTQTNGQSVGKWFSTNTVATAIYNANLSGILFTDGSTSNALYLTNTEGASANVFTKANANTLAAAVMSIDFEIPISQWAGNGTVNLGPGAQIEYASNSSTSTTATDTTSFSTALNQIKSITSGLSRRVRFQYPIQPGDIIMPQISSDGVIWSDMEGAQTIPKAGSFLVNALQNQSGTNYGLGQPNPVSGTTTDVDILFGPYSLANGATYASTGQAWSAGAGNYYWRVRKSSASTPVGFGLATTTQSGLFNAGQNPGIATTGDAAAGNIGEFIQSRQTTLINFPTTTQFGDGASISLTPGDWDVTFVVDGNVNAATMTAFTAGISSTSGNSSTGLQFGDNELSSIVPTVATDSSIVIPTFRVSLAATTTYYGKVSATYSLGNPQYRCRLSARRMR